MGKGRKIALGILIVLFIGLCAAYFALGLNDVTDMALPDKLLWETVPRLVCGGMTAAVVVLCGLGKYFNPLRFNGGWKGALALIPCVLVVLANFPFTALATGGAVIDYPQYIWLFILKCLSIGLIEECVFRGLIHPLVGEMFEGKKAQDLLTVLLSSALFGLWHLTNLFGGAGVGATFLQVGYSFLIGAMMSFLLLRTGNVWICVLFHAAFDFGGLLVGDLGHGAFQDIYFWIFTAIAAVLCTVEVLGYLLKPLVNRGREE